IVTPAAVNESVFAETVSAAIVGVGEGVGGVRGVAVGTGVAVGIGGGGGGTGVAVGPGVELSTVTPGGAADVPPPPPQPPTSSTAAQNISGRTALRASIEFQTSPGGCINTPSLRQLSGAARTRAGAYLVARSPVPL